MDKLLILVDENDNMIGYERKLQAHLDSKLHRAFSIFVFNSEQELLIQKRAQSKYHSAGLWSNTCCSHPAPEETLEEIIHLRLREEMGFDCDLKKIFTFKYNVYLGNGIYENEIDHVFSGEYGGLPSPNPREVDDWKWVQPDYLIDDIKFNPEIYTHWFKIALNRVLKDHAIITL